MEFRITVDADEARAALKEFRKGNLRPELTTVAEKFVSLSKQRAPVLSGRLRNSIRGKALARKATVGSQLIYAAPIHFGWPGHSIRQNPYLLPIYYDRVVMVRWEIQTGLAGRYPWLEYDGQ